MKRDFIPKQLPPILLSYPELRLHNLNLMYGVCELAYFLQKKCNYRKKLTFYALTSCVVVLS